MEDAMMSNSLLLMLSLILSASQAQGSFPTLAGALSGGVSTSGIAEESGTTSDCASPAQLTSRVRSGLRFIERMDAGLIKTFSEAWQEAGDGTADTESVVLIFRTGEGAYTGKLTHFYRAYKRTSFNWNPRAVAIIHTHPNGVGARPSKQDELVAHKYTVPMFTITSRGMFVYDPITRKATKLLNGTEWLSLSKWTPQIYSKLSLEPEAQGK